MQYLDRYLNGEYEAVWAELVALGSWVRDPDLIKDATAVAEFTAPPASPQSHPTEVQRQNRGVSKWSYHYVKELLLSAPRAPKTIQPCVTVADATAVAEFTGPPASPQTHRA